MDWSKPYCRVPDTSEASSSLLSGSLSIRAPLTLDDDSDSEINRIEFSTSSTDISVGSDRAFVVGEMASESGCVERYELYWPSGSDPDECENVVGKVMVGGLVSEWVRPIAQLSWESDGVEEDTEEEGSEVEVEDGGELLGQIKVMVSEFVEHISAPPRVKVSEIEEVESVFVKVSGDPIHGECIEHCSVDSREFSETNTDELSISVLEGGEKVEYVEEESFGHKSNKKLDELGTEGNENEIMNGPNVLQEAVYWGNGLISDSKDDKAEDSDSVESITSYFPPSENVATEVKIEDSFENGKDLVLVAVPFQGNEAKEKVPLEEKDSSIEHDQTSLGLFENCIALDIWAFEGVEEEHESLMGNISSFTELSEHTELKSLEDSNLNYTVKAGDVIHAEWIEDDGVGCAETKEPNFVEEAESMAEESILHYPNRAKNDVEINTDSEILDRGIRSESYCGVEGSGNQIMDTNTWSQPNPNLEIINQRKRNLPEAAEGDFVLCSNFLRLITPSSSVTDKHNFVGETKVRNCEIGRIFSGEIVTHLGKDATIGLKLEDQIAIGEGLILPRSAGVGATACGAKLELCLKQKDSPENQNQTSLGLSLMKWGGGVLLTTNVLSRFSVGRPEIAVHVVLDNKQRGKIAIRTTNSDKLQGVGVIGIISIAVSVFRFFHSRFSVQNSR